MKGLLILAWFLVCSVPAVHGNFRELLSMIEEVTGKEPVFGYNFYGCYCINGDKGMPKDNTDWYNHSLLGILSCIKLRKPAGLSRHTSIPLISWLLQAPAGLTSPPRWTVPWNCAKMNPSSTQKLLLSAHLIIATTKEGVHRLLQEVDGH